MYRVYDKKRNRWIKDDVYLSPDGELFKSNQSIFGTCKLTFLHEDRYVYQKWIELGDKNNVPIYIGDYLKAQVADDKIVTGLVTYAHELSAYIILCFDTEEYYTLGTEICEYIEVVGNVFDEFFDGSNKGKWNGKPSLQD